MLFRELSFRVEAGRRCRSRARTASGKTSLLRMLAGFLAPAAGTIRCIGGDVADGEERGKLVGWLGHHDAVKPQMSVRETLRFFARLYGSDGDIGERWTRSGSRGSPICRGSISPPARRSASRWRG